VSDYSTLWLQKKVNQVATNAALQAIAQTGKALPCTVTAVSGAFVTVSFEVQVPYDVNGVTQYYTLPPVEMPCATSQWFPNPTQINDVGLSVPSDVFLTGITGQGGGIAIEGINPGNLSALVFLPIGTTNFPTPPRANIAWPNAPHGGRIGDSANTTYIDCDPDTGTVTITAGGKSWTFTSAGLTMSNSIVLESHLHTGVTGGSSDTGPPVA